MLTSWLLPISPLTWGRGAFCVRILLRQMVSESARGESLMQMPMRRRLSWANEQAKVSIRPFREKWMWLWQFPNRRYWAATIRGGLGKGVAVSVRGPETFEWDRIWKVVLLDLALPEVSSVGVSALVGDTWESIRRWSATLWGKIL